MENTVLLGRGEAMLKIPQSMWEGHLKDAPAHFAQRLSFMTPDHHKVRYYVVAEIALGGMPLQPEVISDALKIPIDKIRQILDELERNLFFLYRNEEGAVQWAYPVTAQKTPHRIILDSGERLYGA